jgi:hypothetical protein
MQAEVLTAYFGRSVGAEERVTEADWDDFLRRDLLPKLGRDAGSTVFDASGTWGDGSERTKVVTLVAAAGRAAAWRAALAEAIEVYRARFRQHSVGVTIAPACIRGFGPA